MWRVWVRRGRCIGSWWGNRREKDHWGDLGVDGWIILGWISSRWDVDIWTGLGWPRIGTGGVRLLVRWWTFGFREMRGISWLAASQLASQEGLCTVEWVSIMNVKDFKHWDSTAQNLCEIILNNVTNSCIRHTCVTWQDTDCEFSEDDKIVSKHVVAHYIVIKYTSCDTVVFDYILFSKFHTHNGDDTIPRYSFVLEKSR